MRRRHAVTLLLLSLGCFALLGVNSEMSIPMVHAFSKVFAYDATATPTRRTVFYVITFLFAIPSAFISRRLGLRATMLIGLCMFAGGALSSLPATQISSMTPFLVGLAFMSAGLALTESSALAVTINMGKRRSSLTRLFIGKLFETLGYTTGYVMMAYFVDLRLFDNGAVEQSQMDSLYYEAAMRTDLMTVAVPYIWIGAAACIMAVIAALQEINDMTPDRPHIHKLSEINRGLLSDKTYLRGTLTMAAYLMIVSIIWYGIYCQSYEDLTEARPNASALEAATYTRQMIMTTLTIFIAGRIVGIFVSRSKRHQPHAILIGASIGAFVLSVASAVAPGEISTWLLIISTFFLAFIHPTIIELSTSHMDRETVVMATPGIVMGTIGGLAGWLINFNIDDSNTRTLFIAVAVGGIAMYGGWHCLTTKQILTTRQASEPKAQTTGDDA